MAWPMTYVTSAATPSASGRIDDSGPADEPAPVCPLELALVGTASCRFAVASGAVVTPRLGDR